MTLPRNQDDALPIPVPALGAVVVTEVTPGTLATDLGKAEGQVFVAADVGVAAWAVRNDAGTPLAADGRYIPLMVDASGNLYVTGAVVVSPVTPGTGPTNLGKADGGAYAAGDVGVESLAVVDDGTVAVPAVGRYTALRLDPATGALKGFVVNNVTISGTVTANAGVNLNTSLLALEAGNLATLAGVVTAARAAVNPIAGQVGVQGASGVVTALTQRVVLATDVALPTGGNVIGQVTANAGTNLNTSALALEAGNLATLASVVAAARANVNPIAGQVGVQGGSGLLTALTQRVVLATDVPLPAGTNSIGVLGSNSGVDIGDVTVNNGAGVNAVNVQDGGNSLTVDAPVGTPVFVRLSDGAAALIGQKTMALSIPVVIASDQASFPVTASLATTTAGTPAGVTVSTAATLLKASNANRKAIIITNNGVGNLYIGHTNAVTASGANMGLILPPFGAYCDSGAGLYTGDLYGIYDQVAAAQNVSVSERT